MNVQKPSMPNTSPEMNHGDCPADNLVSSPDKLALAMFYVPVQEWTTTYELDVGLCRGTIFPCLDKPFLGKRGRMTK